MIPPHLLICCSVKGSLKDNLHNGVVIIILLLLLLLLSITIKIIEWDGIILYTQRDAWEHQQLMVGPILVPM